VLTLKERQFNHSLHLIGVIGSMVGADLGKILVHVKIPCGPASQERGQFRLNGLGILQVRKRAATMGRNRPLAKPSRSRPARRSRSGRPNNRRRRSNSLRAPWESAARWDAELDVWSDDAVFLAEVPDIVPACVAASMRSGGTITSHRLAEVEAGPEAADDTSYRLSNVAVWVGEYHAPPSVRGYV
jgi:hypothetical protein